MKSCTALAWISIVLYGLVQVRQATAQGGENMTYFLVEHSEGVYILEDLVNADINTAVSDMDITYLLYTNQNPTNATEIKLNELQVLGNSGFSHSVETLFIFHGWINGNESQMSHQIKDAILSQASRNVFIVDWSPIASRNYLSARHSVTTVALHVAEFIVSLRSSWWQLPGLAFVGHCLGAHVAGNVGGILNGEVEYIVGLDPALPLFSLDDNDRLRLINARFVEVIHTNGGQLGFSASLGHSDYFPNGGSAQPGCGSDITGACAHSRAYMYYIESVASANNLFIARLCASYQDYCKGFYRSNSKSIMGHLQLSTESRGDYFLDTNSCSPFAMGWGTK